jgi:hypothetical protein
VRRGPAKSHYPIKARFFCSRNALLWVILAIFVCAPGKKLHKMPERDGISI